MRFYIQVNSTQESKRAQELFKKYYPVPYQEVYASWNSWTGYYALTDSGQITYRRSISESDQSTPVYTVDNFEYDYNLENILK